MHEATWRLSPKWASPGDGTAGGCPGAPGAFPGEHLGQVHILGRGGRGTMVPAKGNVRGNGLKARPQGRGTINHLIRPPAM